MDNLVNENINIWRLHIKTSPTPEFSRQYIFQYCIDNNLAAIGWPVTNAPQSPSEYTEMAFSEYKKKTSSMVFANKISIGDLIWTRNVNGIYFLGRIESPWYYSIMEDQKGMDINNQRKCVWIKIGNEEEVPGKILACFRNRITLQSIDSDLRAYSKWRYLDNAHAPRGNHEMSIPEFFKKISSLDCEDLVGLYLQRVFGYCIIPSSCKIDTIAYEYILKHPDRDESAVVQVKQGKVDLNDSLKNSATRIFLFTTEGIIGKLAQNMTIITSKELYKFVLENKTLLPNKINYWL